MQRRIEGLTGKGVEVYRENIIILCLCRLCRLVVIKLQHCKMLMSCHDIRRDSQDSRDLRPERRRVGRDSNLWHTQLLIKAHNKATKIAKLLIESHSQEGE